MKTAISIPDSLYHAAEQLAKSMELSRSELFARAVKSYIEKHRYHSITEKLNEIYDQGPEDSQLDPALEEMQMKSIQDDEKR